MTFDRQGTVTVVCFKANRRTHELIYFSSVIVSPSLKKQLDLDKSKLYVFIVYFFYAYNNYTVGVQ